MSLKQYSTLNENMKKTIEYFPNYLDATLEYTPEHKRYVVDGIVKKNTSDTKCEAAMRLLYDIRAQMVVLYFFPEDPKYEVQRRNLMDHPGWDAQMSLRQKLILADYRAAQDLFVLGKLDESKQQFTIGDKKFGVLRHDLWLIRRQQGQ
jgi:hypothetical protein